MLQSKVLISVLTFCSEPAVFSLPAPLNKTIIADTRELQTITIVLGLPSIAMREAVRKYWGRRTVSRGANGFAPCRQSNQCRRLVMDKCSHRATKQDRELNDDQILSWTERTNSNAKLGETGELENFRTGAHAFLHNSYCHPTSLITDPIWRRRLSTHTSLLCTPCRSPRWIQDCQLLDQHQCPPNCQASRVCRRLRLTR